MHESFLKKFLSVLLSFLGWTAAVGIPVASELALWRGIQQGKLGVSELLITTLKYAIPLILLGALMLLSATRLWSRWRFGMGFAGLISGILPFREMQLAFDSQIACASLGLNLALGMGLIIWDRYRRSSVKV